MIQVYTHPACLAHETGPGHPERSSRLSVLLRALESAFPDLDWQQAPAASRGQLLRVHDERLLERILEHTPSELTLLNEDTVLSPGSADAALHAAGAGIAAVDAVMSGRTERAFCAVRPPGHHATHSTAMGFCLFNNIAVAARHALDVHGLERVAIADFDVHHGNGTQDIFEHDPRVLFASSHQWLLFPDSGARSEVGCGNIVNDPLPEGSGSDAFRTSWQERLLPAIRAFKPQLLLISAGFDGHARDPLAGLRLEADDFAWVTRQLVKIAETYCSGRVVSILEGGYDLVALAECSVAHVDELRF